MTETAEKNEAKVQSVPWWTWIVLIAICLVFVIAGGIKSCSERKEAEKAAVAKYAATHTPKSARTVEALVLQKECLTPCSAYVGWSYKVRTDGDPIRIKYQGTDWFDQPAKGDFQAPKGFQPGETQFVSPDKKNPHVRVWVYKKIKTNQ